MTKSSIAALVLAVSAAAVSVGCGDNPYAGEANPDAATPAQTGGSAGVSTAPSLGSGGAGGLLNGAGGTTDADATTVDAAADAPTVTLDGSPATVYQVALAPVRKLDLVFMVDNSPSMAPKVAKLSAQFSKLAAALKDPSDGSLPDLRIALIDSDLGTGGAYTSGSCGPNINNGENPYGDLGNFQMRGGTACGMANADALWIEYAKDAPVNYSGDLSKVFSCLATSLGTLGCGEEHSLQSFEFALVARNLHAEGTQNSFLRPEAYLGLVFISDEDDCSAATNDGMFGDKPELRGESASLRCATRGHACGGRNLSDSGSLYPATAAFTTDFATCSARTDSCPNLTDGANSGTDTSGPTTCTPLKSVKSLAQEIKALKPGQGERILVAGIFGWPLAGAGPEPYRIDLVPNPNMADTAHPQVFDYWPVCYDPDHTPKTAGAYDADAWGFGAQGGLRMSAFVDEFGANGLKYSICERDFSPAMQGIGNVLARKVQNLCVPASILGRKCTANYRYPFTDPAGVVAYTQSERALSACPPDATSTDVDCYALVSDQIACPGAKLSLRVLRTAAETAAGPLAEGTLLAITCE